MPSVLNGDKRIYRRLNEQQKRLIVYLRYASLEDFNQAANKIGDIALYMRTPRSTVSQVLKKFVEAGCDVSVFTFKSRRFASVPGALKRFLLEPKTLKAWMPFNLVERSRVVRTLWGFAISADQLRRFYKLHGVKYVTGKPTYHAEVVHRNRLDGERLKFATFMGNVLRLSKPLIYMDETTFNSWQLKPRSWQHPDHRNLHVRPGARHSVTVYGAIGLPLTAPVFSFGGSTNQVDYRLFLRKIKAHQKTTVRGKPLLLFDGHPAHKTPETMRVVASMFHPVLNVPYSCELNSIESFWSVAKSNFNKLMLMRKNEPLSKRDFEAKVTKALTVVPSAVTAKILTANRRELRQLIRRAAEQEEAEDD